MPDTVSTDRAPSPFTEHSNELENPTTEKSMSHRKQRKLFSTLADLPTGARRQKDREYKTKQKDSRLAARNRKNTNKKLHENADKLARKAKVTTT